jgi:hypothetical protein
MQLPGRDARRTRQAKTTRTFELLIVFVVTLLISMLLLAVALRALPVGPGYECGLAQARLERRSQG